MIERFAAAGVPKDKIAFERDKFTFNYLGAPSALADEFRNYDGPTINAFEAAAKSGRATELQANWKRSSRAGTRARAKRSLASRLLSYA